MARRSPGEGTMIQRNGRWVVALQVNGKRRAVYAKTEREARQRLQELREQLALAGSLPTPGRRTVNDLLDAWLEHTAQALKPRTVTHYREVSDRHLRPSLGSLRLSKLEAIHLQRLYASLGGKKRAASHAHQALHRALKLAVLWGWLASNPADRVIPPVYRPERKDVWSAQQLADFLQGTEGHWLHPLFMFLVTSGCRLGEALGLKWSDVGEEAVVIRRTLHFIKGQPVEQSPKTRAGERTIVLPPSGQQALRTQRAQQNAWRLQAGPAWPGHDYVFTMTQGRPLHGSAVGHTMRAFCARLGLPPLTPHGLRHLHASLLLAEGLPLTDVSRRLGHANPSITAAVYSHALPNRDAQAAQAIHRVLSAAEVYA